MNFSNSVGCFIATIAKDLWERQVERCLPQFPSCCCDKTLVLKATQDKRRVSGYNPSLLEVRVKMQARASSSDHHWLTCLSSCLGYSLIKPQFHLIKNQFTCQGMVVATVAWDLLHSLTFKSIKTDKTHRPI